MKMDEIIDVNPTPQSEKTTICILGQKGVGKTYAMAILGDQLQCRTLYLDLIGAFTETQLVRNAIYLRINSTDREKTIQALETGFKKSKRIVLDMRNLVPREKVYMVDIVSQWVMHYGNVAVFLDEVAFVCPQSSRMYSDEFHRLVMAGRNFNCVPVCFSTQRSQTAHKDILALADRYLIFRLIHNLDRNKVKDLIGLKEKEWEVMENEIMTLQRKEAYLFYVAKGERVLKKVIMPEWNVKEGA